MTTILLWRRGRLATCRSPRATGCEDEWIIIGDQRMFVVGYAPGGAPYGYVEEIEYGEPSHEDEPF
jgi:hypothetical protein